METEESELCFPQLINTSCKKHVGSNSESLPIYILLSCISLLIVVLNLLVIVSISHFRQLHTPTNLLLLSLAVSDFLVGLIVVPFQMLLTSPCWLLGDLPCAVFFLLAFNTICSSIANMVLISVDRYVAICDPLCYPNKISQRRVQVCVLLCWLYCGFYSFVILYDNLKQPGRFKSCYGECGININGPVHIMLGFIIPISVIIFLYVRVFVVAVSQARSMRSHVAAVKLQHSMIMSVQRSELKAARTLGVVVVVFLFCFLPYFCVSLSGYDLMMSSSTNTFTNSLLLLNSSLNPMIYVFFYPWFRKSIKIIVTLKILKQNSCQENIL